jgi:putative phosphoribosyl transferase
MYFKDRHDAGRQLAEKLGKFKGEPSVVYGIPRGGVVLAAEIAKHLETPLDLILARKIGHPYNPEYAIAAVSESGHLVGSEKEMQLVGQAWLSQEKEKQLQEIKRRREAYLGGRKKPSLEGKIAIIVDDGIATGLTMQAGILELKEQHPKKIIAVIPVSPKSTTDVLKKMVDEVVALEIPEDPYFLGAVGAYYEEFPQVEDREVLSILKEMKIQTG